MTPKISGIGKKERTFLALLLKANLPAITAKNTSEILEITQARALQILSLLAKKGWLSRVKQGIYTPVPLQSENPNVMVDEPWVLAKALFEPCYIGGWSAGEYWGFTEQIFNSIMVFSTKKIHEHEMHLKGANFTVKTIKKERMFGLKNIWQGRHKVLISDPTKTIIDAFNDPAVVGGIRMSIDLLSLYLKSEHKNLQLLLDYGLQMKNTAVFKRLGFCFEKNNHYESDYLEKMRAQIKSGYSQLDPSSPGESLITAWNLWVPTIWKRGIS